MSESSDAGKSGFSGRFRAMLVASGIIAGALSWFLSAEVPAVRAMETWLADIRLLSLGPKVENRDDFVMVVFTEDTFRKLPYRSPFPRDHMAKILKKILAAQPKAIGIDVLFDVPSFKEADDALADVINNAGIPIAHSWGDADSGILDYQIEFAKNYLPDTTKAAANLKKSSYDNTVRFTFPGREYDDGSFRPGIAYALAEVMGGTPFRESTRIYYRRGTEKSYDSKYEDRDNPMPFKTFKMVRVEKLPQKLIDRLFKDKVVFIGADLPLRDRYRTPFGALYGDTDMGNIPGVMVHAHKLAQYLDGVKIDEPGPFGVIVICLVTGIIGILLAAWDVKGWLRLLAGLGALGIIVAGTVLPFPYGGPLLPILSPLMSMGFALAFGTALVSYKHQSEKKFIKDAFMRYVSPDVIDDISANPDALKLGGDRRALTFIFTDIAGFTTLSESMQPEELTAILNEYLTGMSEIVLEEGGTIDKYIGDAVMAFFGAPMQVPDHSDRAIRCAFRLDRFAQQFEKSYESVGMGMTRIGIHTGDAVVGNFGGENRFDYTSIGDTVNTSARLEGANKYFLTTLCCSMDAINNANMDDESMPEYRPIGDVIVKGRAHPLRVCELVGRGECDAAAFREAFGKLDNGDVAGAKAGFEALAAKEGREGLLQFQLDRLDEGATDTQVTLTGK